MGLKAENLGIGGDACGAGGEYEGDRVMGADVELEVVGNTGELRFAEVVSVIKGSGSSCCV